MNRKLTLIIFLTTITSPIFSQINVLRLDQLTTKDGLPHNSVQAIIQDKFGLIWLSSFAGLYNYDGYEFNYFSPDPADSNALISGGVYNLISDSLKNIYVTFFDTSFICKYNYNTGDFTRISRYKLDKEFISKITRKKKHPIKTFETENSNWEYSNNILSKKNKLSGKVSRYFVEPPQNQIITNELVSSIFIDKHKNLWLGTENQGIYKVNTNSKPFFSYFHENTDNKVLIKDIVRAIYVDKKENLWIGTFYNGIYFYNRQKNELTTIRHNPENIGNSLISDEIRSIFKDSKGRVWIGTKAGLSRYNQKTKTFKNYNKKTTPSIVNNWVHAITEDHNNTIWIGTFQGIERYDEKSGEFIPYDPKLTLMNSQVVDILEDRNHNLWIATQSGGVTCLRRKNNSESFNPIHYINNIADTNTISSNRVFSLNEDNTGYIWIATEYGLNRLNPNTGDFLRFTQKQKLPDEMIMGVLNDNYGNIWFSHKKGLSKINTNSLEIRNYSEQDGLQSNEFSENACFKNPITGELYFGGTNGYNSFYSNKISENLTLPKVVFTGLEVLNQEVKPKKTINGRIILQSPITNAEKILLKYSDKSFSIKFAALHYSNSKSNRYKYMLDGYDKYWIDADPSVRIATYSNLPAGKYIFKVIASNNDNVWNQQAAELTINISPPWWNNWIAYLGYFLLAIMVFYFIYDYIISREKFRNQMRYERMKTNKIIELDEMKMQFFTNVSHEFRTPLSLIIDPLRKLNQGEVNPKQAKYYYSVMYQNAQILLRLINQLLDLRKLEKGHVRPDLVQADIVSFSKNAFNTFKIRSKQRGIKYQFKSTHPSIIARFDSEKLEKILNNLLSNAFKYTDNNGEISLEIDHKEEAADNFVIFKVRDNGVGIALKSQQKIFDRFYQAKTTKFLHPKGTGIGLAYSKQLVDLLDGKISVKSEPGKGSTFKVKLPMGNIDKSEISEPIVSLEDTIVTPERLSLEKPKKKTEQKEESTESSVILIVEDNEDVRAYIKNELSDQYEILEASNGTDGISCALENVPDIIISDIMMPETDGLELCKTIKSDERTSHIPLVLLTARQSDTYKAEGYEFGADAYVTKPFSTSVLLAIIKNLINSRVKLKDAFSKSPFVDVKRIAGNSTDENFLNIAIETVENSISNSDFNIDGLSDILKLSRRQLTHKIKTLTGHTVLEFIKTVRLNKGAKLLLSKEYSISEVSYMLGYNVPANFSRSFSKQFGKTPTEYIDTLTNRSD